MNQRYQRNQNKIYPISTYHYPILFNLKQRQTACCKYLYICFMKNKQYEKQIEKSWMVPWHS